MNFITLKELKKMVPVASEFKRVPGLKKILEDGIEVILRKQMENHAEVVVYKNGYVSYHDGLRGNLCSPHWQHPGIFGHSLGTVRHDGLHGDSLLLAA